MFNEVKDSGKRQEFETGAVRDTSEGKGRYDLIPVYALKRLARHYENGAKKYGDNNWKKGMPLRRYYDSAMRHLGNWMEGNRDEDHLAAVLFNVMAIIETEQMIKDGKLPYNLLVDDTQIEYIVDEAYKAGHADQHKKGNK